MENNVATVLADQPPIGKDGHRRKLVIDNAVWTTSLFRLRHRTTQLSDVLARNALKLIFLRGFADYAASNRLEELSEVRWRISAQSNPPIDYVRAPNVGAIPKVQTQPQTIIHQFRGKAGEQTMFSLTEVEDNKFIYRCHQCCRESESMTTEQVAIYSRLHQCSAESASRAVEESRKAS